MDKIEISKKDANFIFNLLPKWVKDVHEGLDPTMYGTLSASGDNKIKLKVEKILKINDE